MWDPDQEKFDTSSKYSKKKTIFKKNRISMGKPPNKMGNCPFASPLVAPLKYDNATKYGFDLFPRSFGRYQRTFDCSLTHQQYSLQKRGWTLILSANKTTTFCVVGIREKKQSSTGKIDKLISLFV